MTNSTDQQKKRTLEGVVVSDGMEKTVVVEVNSMRTHPKYLKQYMISKKYQAHDENNEFHVGDEVEIIESKNRSKNKKWEVSRKIK